jgi:hypothetical protein
MKQLKKDNRCDRIFIISPTAFSPANEPMFRDLGVDYKKDVHEDMANNSLVKVKVAVDEEGAQWKKDQEDQEKYTRLLKLLRGKTPIDHIDAELLTGADQAGWFHTPPKARYGHKPRLHCLIDDAQGSPLMVPTSNSCLGNLSVRHRHAGGCGVSLYVAVQNYTANQGVPRYLRTNCTVLVLFKIHDAKTIQQILTEVAGDVPAEDFMRHYHEATEEPYQPLVVEFGAKRHIFRAGWSKFLTSTADPPKGVRKPSARGPS